MLRKAFRRLSKVTSRKRPEAATAPVHSNPVPHSRPTNQLLTAEGWKRLMMKKHRNS